eukprot:5678655-Amphidinium_carterae.1
MATWEDIWWDVWPAVCSPSVLEQVSVEELQEISKELRERSLGCQKPKLKRFSYKHHTEQSGWADYNMPITP